jgi:hypothetical protein
MELLVRTRYGKFSREVKREIFFSLFLCCKELLKRERERERERERDRDKDRDRDRERQRETERERERM